MTNRCSQLLSEASLQLRSLNADRCYAEARLLLSSLTGRRIEDFLSDESLTIDDAQAQRFRELVSRRLSFEPVAYLVGEKEFYGRRFQVSRDVLIPRPETESLVSAVLHWLELSKIKHPQVLDLGTGSGCIGISLERELQGRCHVFGVDLSEQALEIARLNAKQLQCKSIEFMNFDFRELSERSIARRNLPPRWDVIVSNPPYISDTEWKDLPDDIRSYEPRLALEGGVDGLRDLKSIISNGLGLLKRPGLLALETGGPHQIQALREQIEALRLSLRSTENLPILCLELLEGSEV